MSLSRQGGIPLPIHRFDGDPRLQQITGDLCNVRDRLMDWGVLITPDIPLVTALSLGSAGGTSPDGITLIFSEGTWDFGATTFTIAKHRINIVALSPGRTVFRRASGVVLAARTNVLTVSGNDIRFSGIRFVDSVGDAGDACLELAGSRIIVDRCVFEDCDRAVILTGSASRCEVTNCMVLAARNTTRTINAAGTHSYLRFTGNTFLSAAAVCIYAADTVTYSRFNDNADNATVVVSYLAAAAGNVNAGNVGTVTLR